MAAPPNPTMPTSRVSQKRPSRIGHHGRVSAMGVPLTELPRWSGFRFSPPNSLVFRFSTMKKSRQVSPSARRRTPVRLEIPCWCRT